MGSLSCIFGPIFQKQWFGVLFYFIFLAHAYCEGMEKTLRRRQMQGPHFRVCFIRVQQVGRRGKANKDQSVRQRKN